MMKSAVGKVMWVGRVTVFLVGLAVILALLFGLATTALAGTGVGATFNLGRVNSVNKMSSLIGSASSAMLKIDNNGAGPALTLQVEPGKRPMTVNSDRKVARLNADKLDNLSSNELVRSGLGVRQDLETLATFTSQMSVTVDAPGKGFVIANGAAMIDTSSSSCNPCYVHVEILNSTTNERSPVLIDSVGNGTTTLRDAVLSTTWVFPVNPGNNTFQLRTAPIPGGTLVNISNPRLSAVYVPYGATGTSTLASSSQLAAPARGGGETLQDGSIRK